MEKAIGSVKIRIKEFQKAVEKVITHDEFIQLYGIDEFHKLTATGQSSGPTVADRFFSAEVVRKWLVSVDFQVEAPTVEIAKEKAAEKLLKELEKLKVVENTYAE